MWHISMKVNVDKDVITSKTRVKVLIYTPRKCFNLGRILLSEVIFYRNLYLRCREDFQKKCSNIIQLVIFSFAKINAIQKIWNASFACLLIKVVLVCSWSFQKANWQLNSGRISHYSYKTKKNKIENASAVTKGNEVFTLIALLVGDVPIEVVFEDCGDFLLYFLSLTSNAVSLTDFHFN